MNTKKCTKCFEIKNIQTDFYKNKLVKDGYQAWCRNCKHIYKQNPACKEKAKLYRKTNKNKSLKYQALYRKQREQNDINFKIARRLSSRIYNALKNNYKSGSAVRDLGCTVEQLKVYLESKFTEGMSWNNYGLHSWHIDHIMPLSSFDLADKEQFKKACHYTNLQPLWAKDNIIKSNKILKRIR